MAGRAERAGLAGIDRDRGLFHADMNNRCKAPGTSATTPAEDVPARCRHGRRNHLKGHHLAVRVRAQFDSLEDEGRLPTASD